ncbi:MAG: hypothetical protein JXQ29_02945 [Planctomycetes bacterium]|nr:hypothetical protein [Planctomycetota bacterium]
MRLVLLALLGATLVAPGLAAQNDGDAIVVMFNSPTGDLLLVTPAGVVTTMITRPGTNLPEGLAVAPGNDGGMFVETNSSTRALSVLKFQNAVNLTTLTTLAATHTRVPTLLADQGGDILLLSAAGNDRGVYRMPAKGGPLTTIAHNTLGATFMSPFAMAEDPVSGDIVVLDITQYLHRIDRTGKVTTIRCVLPPSTSIAVTGNVDVDTTTGLMYVTYANFLLTLDPQTGATTTIFQSTTTNRAIFYGIDNDPFRGGFYLSVNQSLPTPAGRYLLRYDTRTAILTTVATLPAANVTQMSDVITWKSRMLSGLSRPAWGQPYVLRLEIPSERGQGYAAAAALGTLQGIMVGGRRIPLDPDPLFFATLQLPGIFSGFQGVLNATGMASLTVNTPTLPGLAGVRFYLAAVTYDAGGIRLITEPLGVTIE